MQTIPNPKYNKGDILNINNEELIIVRREFRYNYETEDYDIYYIFKKQLEDTYDYKTVTESSIVRKNNASSYSIENLKTLCKKYVLDLKFYKKDAYIKVFGEEWCIEYENVNKVTLWHKNESRNIHDYHVQKEFKKTEYPLEYIINYILGHGIDNKH